MVVAPEVTQMWSRDAFKIKTDRGMRKTASIVEAYQITVPPTYTPIQIVALAGMPVTGDAYPGLPDMRAVSRNFTRHSPIYYTCVVSFEGPNVSPINEPPIIKWTDTESDEPIDQDWDGNPIVTANDEPIDGVTMKVPDPVLTVERNYRAFNPHLTHQYRLSVSSDAFASYPAGTARLVRYSADQKWDETSGGYWAIKASIQFRYPYNTTPAKAWHARVRHEGYYERIGSDIVRAVDDNKEPVTRPVLLRSDGTRETNAAAAHWLEFKKYQALPYSILGLL